SVNQSTACSPSGQAAGYAPDARRRGGAAAAKQPRGPQRAAAAEQPRGAATSRAAAGSGHHLPLFVVQVTDLADGRSRTSSTTRPPHRSRVLGLPGPPPPRACREDLARRLFVVLLGLLDLGKRGACGAGTTRHFRTSFACSVFFALILAGRYVRVVR
ncbi:unnamed protein product, partial [Urochloa humidicola]